MRPEWKHTLIIILACAVFIAACWFCIPRAQAQDACAAAAESVYALQPNVELTADGVALVSDWQLDDTRWGEAIGLPEYTLYINLNADRDERQYWKLFASRTDASVLVVMRWSDIASARVDAWYVNHATDDGLAAAQAACEQAQAAVAAEG